MNGICSIIDNDNDNDNQAKMAVENFHVPPARPVLQLATGARRSQAIHSALQREIVMGELAPRAVLRELELVERFGVSQGTVREALLSLQEEGLVLRQPHRGTSVADCRADDAEELIRIRHDIECRGVRRAMARAGRKMAEPLARELDAMRIAAAAGDEYALSVHDRSFHMRLYAFADLPPVEPVLSRALVHVHRFKILHPAQGRDLMETANRHQGIVDAIADGNADLAASALAHHVMTIVDLGPRIVGEEARDK